MQKNTKIKSSALVLLMLAIFLIVILFLINKNKELSSELQIINNSSLSEVVEWPLDEEKTTVSKELLIKMLYDYIDTNNLNKQIFTYEWLELLTKIDYHLTSYELPTPLLKVFSLEKSERRILVEQMFEEVDKNSMWYATLSDYLQSTQLCENFDNKNDVLFCKDQTDTLKYIMSWEEILFSNLSLGDIYLHSLYSTINNKWKQQHLEDTKVLIKNFFDENGTEWFLN